VPVPLADQVPRLSYGKLPGKAFISRSTSASFARGDSVSWKATVSLFLCLIRDPFFQRGGMVSRRA
jgi:hypothetical protein